MAINIDEKDGSVTFGVRVIPRSSRSQFVVEHGGVLKVKLKSPPVEGAANEELVLLFSKEFKISRSAIAIVSGETSKSKRVRIDGITASQVTAVLKAKT
jgi:uncharacterized protein (TIGR00251 family)